MSWLRWWGVNLDVVDAILVAQPLGQSEIPEQVNEQRSVSPGVNVHKVQLVLSLLQSKYLADTNPTLPIPSVMYE
jgi:hypothetical protein